MKQTATAPVPRKRVSGEPRTGSPVYDTGSGPVTNYTTLMGYAPPQGELQIMWDQVVPHFKQRVAAGEVFFNPMQSVRFSFSSTSKGSGVLQHTPAWAAGQRYAASGDLLGYLIGGTASPTTTMVEPLGLGELPRSNAIKEACTKAASRPTDASLLVSLAESQQTLRMLPSALKTMADFLRTVNRAGTAKNKSLGSSLNRSYQAHERMLVDLWLQARFGLRPLIADVNGAITAFKRKYDDAVMRQTSRGFATCDLTDVSTFELSSGVVRLPVTRTTVNRYSVRAMSLWQGRMELADQLGLSPWQLGEAIVDLTRFSFVLNWMVNVNDFARAISSSVDHSWSNLGGCYVAVEERTTVWQFLGGDYCTEPWTYNVDGQSSGLASAVKVTKTRVPGLVAPSLTVRASPLAFTRDLRLIDAVALLSQQLRGRNVAALGRLSRASAKSNLSF